MYDVNDADVQIWIDGLEKQAFVCTNAILQVCMLLSWVKACNGAFIQVEVYRDASRFSPSIQVRVLSIETSRCRDTPTVCPFDHLRQFAISRSSIYHPDHLVKDMWVSGDHFPADGFRSCAVSGARSLQAFRKMDIDLLNPDAKEEIFSVSQWV